MGTLSLYPPNVCLSLFRLLTSRDPTRDSQDLIVVATNHTQKTRNWFLLWAELTQRRRQGSNHQVSWCEPRHHNRLFKWWCVQATKRDIPMAFRKQRTRCTIFSSPHDRNHTFKNLNHADMSCTWGTMTLRGTFSSGIEAQLTIILAIHTMQPIVWMTIIGSSNLNYSLWFHVKIW